jgi:hypothetical protein
MAIVKNKQAHQIGMRAKPKMANKKTGKPAAKIIKIRVGVARRWAKLIVQPRHFCFLGTTIRGSSLQE